MAEQSRGENIEAEPGPDVVVDNAVSAAENRDATESAPEAVANAKKWLTLKGEGPRVKGALKDEAVLGWDASRFGITLALKQVWGILKFAKTVIEKKGKITFKEGYELGKEPFSFDSKKEKKK